MRLYLFAPAILFVLPGQSGAVSLEILSSYRFVEAFANAMDFGISDDDFAFESTEGTEPFSEEVVAATSLGSANSFGFADQISSYAPSGFDGEGNSFASADAFSKMASAYSYGGSTLHVVFRLSGACGYTLDGFLQASGIGGSNASLTLDGLGGTILAEEVEDQNLPIQESGILQAGDYDLTVSVYSGASGGPFSGSNSSGEYELHFALDPATVASHTAGEILLRASPNPFTVATRINAPEGAQGVRIFDAAGRLVRAFEGSKSYEWDGRDEAGAATPAGVYFIRAAQTPAAPIKLVRIR